MAIHRMEIAIECPQCHQMKPAVMAVGTSANLGDPPIPAVMELVKAKLLAKFARFKASKLPCPECQAKDVDAQEEKIPAGD